MEHAAPAALLGPRTHGHALGAGARHDDLLYLLGGWQGAGLFMLGRGGGPSGTGLWSATVTFLSVWAAHFTLARHVVYLIEGPSGVFGGQPCPVFSPVPLFALDDIAKSLG